MQSKYKLTRQIPLTTTYYDAKQVIDNSATLAFAFYPISGQGLYTNVNTTKGTMVSGQLDALFGGTLISSINDAVDAAGGSFNVVLRDLGKTIFSSYYSLNGLVTTKGYFRHVQLISPTSIGSNGWNGGPNGSTFGVTGYPSEKPRIDPLPYNSTSYLTFYIPVSIANIIAEGATSTRAFAIAGGQM
jgi:hypothetical protein